MIDVPCPFCGHRGRCTDDRRCLGSGMRTHPDWDKRPVEDGLRRGLEEAKALLREVHSETLTECSEGLADRIAKFLEGK